MENGDIIELKNREYKFVKKLKNTNLFEDMQNGCKICFDDYDLGLLDNEELDRTLKMKDFEIVIKDIENDSTVTYHSMKEVTVALNIDNVIFRRAYANNIPIWRKIPNCQIW